MQSAGTYLAICMQSAGTLFWQSLHASMSPWFTLLRKCAGGRIERVSCIINQPTRSKVVRKLANDNTFVPTEVWNEAFRARQKVYREHCANDYQACLLCWWRIICLPGPDCMYVLDHPCQELCMSWSGIRVCLSIIFIDIVMGAHGKIPLCE